MVVTTHTDTTTAAGRKSKFAKGCREPLSVWVDAIFKNIIMIPIVFNEIMVGIVEYEEASMPFIYNSQLDER